MPSSNSQRADGKGGGLRVKLFDNVALDHRQLLFLSLADGFADLDPLFAGDAADYFGGLFAPITEVRELGQAKMNCGTKPRPHILVVAGAEAAAHSDGNLRHTGIGHRLNHLRAVLDAAALLRLAANHVTGGVHQVDNGNADLATQLDKLAGLDLSVHRDGAVVAVVAVVADDADDAIERP